MRGKVSSVTNIAIQIGITPAYAGKSRAMYAGDRARKGSPPPMRGKANAATTFAPSGRITPAYAGKSIKDCVPVLVHMGSPPPMRGKALDEILRDCRRRITPAYAGKSRRHLKLLLEIEDHPRLCGEKCYGKMDRYMKLGSPPPMRGKVSKEEVRETLHRITPAYAGKRDTSTSKYSAIRDHPRLCGEKCFRVSLCRCY